MSEQNPYAYTPQAVQSPDHERDGVATPYRPAASAPGDEVQAERAQDRQDRKKTAYDNEQQAIRDHVKAHADSKEARAVTCWYCGSEDLTAYTNAENEHTYRCGRCNHEQPVRVKDDNKQ